jgi:hypothetical protein
MYKCLAVVAFVLLVLTGAMGLRTLAVTHAANFDGSTVMMQGRPFPPSGGHNLQGRPFPPSGGHNLQGRPFPPSGGHNLQGRPFPPSGGHNLQGRPFPPSGGHNLEASAGQ